MTWRWRQKFSSKHWQSWTHQHAQIFWKLFNETNRFFTSCNDVLSTTWYYIMPQIIKNGRPRVHRAVLIQISVFFRMTQRVFVDRHKLCREVCCLHLQATKDEGSKPPLHSTSYSIGFIWHAPATEWRDLSKRAKTLVMKSGPKRYGVVMEVRVHYLIFYCMTPVWRVSTLQITYCLHFKGVKTEAADSSKT